METIRGKHTLTMDDDALQRLVRQYLTVSIDLGTGDGRFVRHAAATHPTNLAIGVDACRETLYERSRRAPKNALFVIANALSLPPALAGLAGSVTINFPWGSLLAGLLTGDPVLLSGLRRVALPGASLEIRLNGGALDEQGWSLDTGTEQIRRNLGQAGFTIDAPLELTPADLRGLPSTWARRLSHGRDPRGTHFAGVVPGTRCLAEDLERSA